MPNWTKEQELAITETGKNIIVSAGAGSGKTAVLTERVIRKLKSGISIKNLLILTFTNNAAHEMKERIKNAIKKESENNPKLKKDLEFIDSAYITTFDAFSLNLVKKYHYKLNINKDISIIDSSVINLKKEEILDEIFENLYKKKDNKFITLVDLLCSKDDKELKNLILNIDNKINLKENKQEYLDNYIENFYDDSFLNSIIIDYEKLLLTKINDIKFLLNNLYYEIDGKYYENFENELKPLINSKNYDDIKNNKNITLPTLRNATVKGKNIKKEINDIIKYIDNACYYSKDELLYNLKSTKNYVEIIIDIINKLDNKLNKFKKSINKYEFIDISMMAIDIVKNNDDIREELKNNFKEICIDEYQDTNDLQEYFISLIADNNVYMVGDIKQSIYKFRNANPTLFKNKYKDYSNQNNGIKIDLNKNFRSRNQVLKNINEIFNLIMDEEIGGADYIESHNMIYGNIAYDEEGYTNQNYDLEIYNYNYDKDSIYKKDEIEAFIIANDIKEKIKSNYKIFDMKSKTLKNIDYKDFVVLVDRSSNFDMYKKIFEYLSIPTTLYKDENIVNESILKIIKNIISLIIKIKNNELDQEFKYYFMAVSRSYVEKLDDDELFEIINNETYNETNLYKICLEISKDADNLNNTTLLDLIVEKFDFINKFITVGDIENKITIIDYLTNTFKELDNIEYGIYELNSFLDDIISQNKSININMTNDESNAVKIMTIHKSKGLEFQICYFSGYSKKFNLQDLNEKIIFDNKYGIIVPFYNEGLDTLITKDIIKDNYIKEDISERIRLFYVALTRAKEKMIIVTNLEDDENTKSLLNKVDINLRKKYKSFNDILKSIYPNISKYIKNINLDDIYITQDYTIAKTFDYTSKIKKSNEVITVKEINVQKEKVLNKHFSKSDKVLINKKTKDNINYGLYLHELFESIDFNNVNYELLNQNEINYINNFLNQSIFKNINEALIKKEYEFIYEENNIKYHGIIDLMLIYDYIDIVDYKLMNVLSEDYIKQLNGYKQYIENKFNKKTNIYLYSILNNELSKIQD